MTVYIKREYAVDAVLDVYYDTPDIDLSGEKFESAILKIQAADVAPVRHGRWIDGDPYCPICRKNKFVGLDADIWADWKPDYCPNCGAKMDGGDGNSDICSKTI